jgi:alanine-synthesizing transaminase
MFSRRLPLSLEPNRISRAVEDARASGAPLCDLTETNPTSVGLRYPTDEILHALSDPKALIYEPTPHGLPAARRAVAAYYLRHAQTIDPAQLYLTASTSEAYAWLFKLLCDPGDQILVPQPSYPLFDLLAGLESVEVAPYPLRYHGGWYLDIEEVRRALTDRTRAILVVNPNNPTGSYLTRDQLDGLAALCQERELALISDEVFADYGFAPNPARVTTLAGETRALTFVMSGLSKVVGLPQLKLGWIHVGGPPALRKQAAQRLELIADTYLSVAAPVQHAAARLLSLVDDVGAQIAARVRENRAVVAHAVAGTSLGLLDAEGGWTAILRVPKTRTEEEWVLLLLGAGVLVHPGFFFDLPDEAYLVVSLLVPPAVLSDGITRLVACVEA